MRKGTELIRSHTVCQLASIKAEQGKGEWSIKAQGAGYRLPEEQHGPTVQLPSGTH